MVFEHYFKKFTKPTFSIGAFTMIFDDQNRILLAHRTDMDLWNLPGGAVEHGESPWDGVIREVKEEVSIDVEVVKLCGVYSKKTENDVVFHFLCKQISGELAIGDHEGDAVEYFAYEDIPKNMNPKQKERIDLYLSNPDVIQAFDQSGTMNSKELLEQLYG